MVVQKVLLPCYLCGIALSMQACAPAFSANSRNSNSPSKSTGTSVRLESIPSTSIRLGRIDNECVLKKQPVLRGYAEHKQNEIMSAAEENAEALSAVQYKRSSNQILSGKAKLELSPRSMRALQAQLDLGRRNPPSLATRAAEQLKEEFAKPKPAAAKELLQASQQRLPADMQREFETQKRSKYQREPVVLGSAERQLKSELERAKKREVSESLPSLTSAPADLSSSLKQEYKRAAEMAQTESTRINEQVQAQLLSSKPAITAEMAKADAEMKTLFRLSPHISDDAPKGRSEKDISWDSWYASLAKACEQRLLRSLARLGNPSGANTISITVWRNHALTAHLIRGDQSDFDAATLEAYKSLNKDAVLEFPNGSRRMDVTFFVDNEHAGSGAVSAINSQSCVGDEEIQNNSGTNKAAITRGVGLGSM